jgi:thiol-disulfide isomerase/thioredoxin
MSIPLKSALALLFVFFAAGARVLADGLSCESSPAIEAAQADLDHRLQTATFGQALALKEASYQRLIQLDPSDYRPIRDYLSNLHYDQPEKFYALQNKAALETPEKPVQIMTTEILLFGKDTPRAFRLLEQLAEKQPNYAPVYIEQTNLYSRAGKYADKEKAAKAIERFYQLCPSSMDSRPMRYLKQMGSLELRKSVAQNLRARLAGSSDPRVLRLYTEIWSLEFSSLPIADHPKERQQVAEDLTRLQRLLIQPTAEWLYFLHDGYKQSGASEAQVKAMADRILHEFPQSQQAFSVSYNNWKEQHPLPPGEASAAEWQQYMRLALAYYAEIAGRFPQFPFIHGYGGYYAVEYGPYLDGMAADEIVRSGEAYIKESDTDSGPQFYPRYSVALALLRQNIQPAGALALLKEAQHIRDSAREKVLYELPDYAKPKDIEDNRKGLASIEISVNLAYLRACRAASDKTVAGQLRAKVEGAPPTDADLLASYWNSRAVLAEIEGRTTDALAFYQKALFTREPPKPRYGKLDDTLLADAKRLWTAAQGSEAAFAVWSHADNSAKPALAEGRWEKPDKELPAFELVDLQGKTWKLASLEGKKVLINVWATWCGPCQSELPRLEQLYKQTKDRSDLAILTLNMDADQGMIEPFVKKKGFTFPVLPAYSLLSNKIDVDSIPRNWLIGANGKWLWEQIGFDSSEADWGKGMLARLEELK